MAENSSVQPEKNRKKPVLSPIMRLQLRRKHYRNEAQRQGRLDWQALHERSAQTGSSPDPKINEARVLRERAAELARPVESVVSGASADTLVILRHNHCQIALEVEYVREIIPLESITYVPGVPEFIAGVVNARGKILTVVNLEVFLRRNPTIRRDTDAAHKQTVVMLEMGSFEFGVLCEGFPVIGQHNSTQFHEIPGALMDYRTEYLKGIDREGALLVNLAALTADPEFIVDQQ